MPVPTKKRSVSDIELALCVTIVVLLCCEGFSAGYPPERSVLSVAVYQSLQTSPPEVSVLVGSAAGSMSVRISVLPGTIGGSQSRAVYLFEDPGFPLRYAATNDLLGFWSRTVDYLRSITPDVVTGTVDSSQLPGFLSSHPNSTLVVFGYGELPSSVLSENSSLLRDWLLNGGTLFWAGGPIGFYEGSVNATGQYVHQDLGWNGQLMLLGFPLTDPIGNPSTHSAGPAVSAIPTPLGTALGISFPGTSDAANVSQVSAHGGFSLGFESSPTTGPSEPAPRTSLAYVPVGKGSLFFFGGAIWGYGTGSVSNADLDLSSDVGLLAGLGFVPTSEGAQSGLVQVPPFAKVSSSFALMVPRVSEVVLVTSQVLGNRIFCYASSINPPLPPG